MKKLLLITMALAPAFAAEGYKVLNRIQVGGSGGWDYLLVDPSSDRLFVSHGSQVEVLDPVAGKRISTIPDTPGVHGVAIVPEVGKGFITSRGRNAAIVFDLKTLQKTGEIKTGENPDAICYEPKSKRVYTFNHSGNSATAIDPQSGAALSTFSIGPAPEFCVADGAGKLYANLEDSHETVEIDGAAAKVARRVSLAPQCKGPTGLAIDTKDHLLFAVCAESKTMVVVDYAAMKVIGSAPVGAGPDGAAFDPGTGLAFSSNGQSGNLTVVKNVGGKWTAVETVETARGARTVALDPRTHRLYLSTAEYRNDAKTGRPAAAPGTFQVLVVGR